MLIYTLIVAINSQINEPFWLLPASYLSLFIVAKRNRQELGKTPGNMCLNLILFLRYVVLPLNVMTNNFYDGFSRDFLYINKGIYLMVYELIAVFVSNEFFLKKYSCASFSYDLNSITFQKNSVFLFFSIFVLVLLAFLNPSFFQGTSLITQGFLDQEELDTKRSAYEVFMSLLWQSLTTWTYVYFIILQKHKYVIRDNKRFVLNSALATLLFLLITFIAQSSISRWYTIINAIACVYFLIKLFFKEKKFILPVILSPLVVVLTIVTIYKNVSVDSDVNMKAATSLMTSRFLDSYLAGPISTNNAIGLYKTGTVGIHNMPNDIVYSMPIVNHLFSEKDASNYLYNDYIGRVWEDHVGDQILPLIGQGLFYFGPLLSIILSIISVYFLCVFDYRFGKSRTPYMFIFAFIAAWFGVEMCLNMTINLSWIYIRIIPMMLLFYFSDKIRLFKFRK